MSPPTNFHQAIVIGAGIAGLGCASRLREDGHEDVIILEGNSRIGGRIASKYVDGNRLDLGANWIHGTGDPDDAKGKNPLLRFVKRDRTKDLGKGQIFCQDQDGCREITSAWWEIYGELEEHLHGLAAERPAREGSIAEAISHYAPFKERLASSIKELQCLPQFLELKEAAPLRGQDQMSLQEYSTDEYSGDDLFLRDGYTPVIEAVGKDVIELASVRLNTVVSRIDWSGSNIKLTTSKGDYYAKTVVCTIPLGVLKNIDQGHLSFSPALPESKRQSIQRLGFGTLDKVFMIFDQPWWTLDPYRQVYDDPNELPEFLWGLSSSFKGSMMDSKGHWQDGPQAFSCIDLQSLTGFPVFSAFFSSTSALKIESLTEEEVADVMHRTLSSWYKREVPRPRKIHITRWNADPFFCGSYSYVPVGSSAKDRDTLAQPLISPEGAEVRFAGEHTVTDSYATAHGALLSGWREAGLIKCRESPTAQMVSGTDLKTALNDFESRVQLLGTLEDMTSIDKNKLKLVLGESLVNLREEIKRQRSQMNRTDQAQIKEQMARLEKLWRDSAGHQAQARFSLNLAAEEMAGGSDAVMASGDNRQVEKSETRYKYVTVDQTSSTVFLDNCKYCVYVLDESMASPPTIHATNCTQCMFVGRFHQLRIHRSRQCGIWTPKIIMEHCKDIKTGRDSTVNDFDWLQETPSPNWQRSERSLDQMLDEVRIIRGKESKDDSCIDQVLGLMGS